MTSPRLFPFALAVAALLAISGCATSTATDAVVSATSDSTAETATVDKAEKAEAAPEPERVDVPIPTSSLLPLLEAEFALRAGQFAYALGVMGEQIQVLNDPDLAKRTLRLAEFLRNDEQSLLAAIRLTELDTTDGAAAATAMSILAKQGDAPEAMVYARIALERGARINAPLLVADMESLPASSRAAVAAGIEELATQWSDDIDIAIARALLYRETFATGRAEAILEELLQAHPDDERGLVLWTQVQLDIDAEQPFQRMGEAVARNPGNEQLRLQYARLLAANEQFALASEEFSTLINASPRNDEYLMAGALIDLELDRFDAAAASLNELISLGQRVDEAHYYLGRTLEEAQRENEAIEAYARVGSTREFVDAKRRAGLLVTELEDESALIGFFVEQRMRFPTESERLFLIEAELFRPIETESALSVYSNGLTEFPASIPLLYGRAMLREASGDFVGMEADLRTILANNPDNATTLNALGYTLTNHTDRYDEAAALIERALAITPQEPAMLDSLGWVYFKMGRLAEAETILREAYTLLPDPEVAAHLGEALWAQGKQIEARDIWRAVLDTDAGNTHVRATLNRLGVVLD